jgi:hypothetical protein
MAALLPSPELQFIDADGKPYAGGTLTTFVPGTTTGKTTWRDPAATVANTNPITLDTAGRCICYGDGNYRLILDDAAGNLIFDQPSTTLVSVAMAPVVIAPTLADARRLLGVDDAIADEAAARAAADAAEQNARIAADVALGVRIDNETAARIAGDNALGARIDALPPPPPASNVQGGSAGTDSSGRARVTFAHPFSTTCSSFVVTPEGNGFYSTTFSVIADRLGADVWAMQAGSPIPKLSGFFWLATGD